MKAGRQQHSATLLPDGRILIAGGYESDGQHWTVLSSAEPNDPGTEGFTPIGSMGESRMSASWPSAGRWPDGRERIVRPACGAMSTS